MSVISKMDVRGVRDFGDGTLVTLNCVYESDGLNTDAWEDRRFTKATPWGEAQLTTPHAKAFELNKPFYLVFVEADNYEEIYKPLASCVLALFVRAQKTETWPGTTSLEIVKDKSVDDPVTQTTSLNIRMAIDNPAASIQFTEGGRYYCCFYRADEVTLHEAAAGA